MFRRLAVGMEKIRRSFSFHFTPGTALHSRTLIRKHLNESSSESPTFGAFSIEATESNLTPRRRTAYNGSFRLNRPAGLTFSSRQLQLALCWCLRSEKEIQISREDLPSLFTLYKIIAYKLWQLHEELKKCCLVVVFCQVLESPSRARALVKLPIETQENYYSMY